MIDIKNKTYIVGINVDVDNREARLTCRDLNTNKHWQYMEHKPGHVRDMRESVERPFLVVEKADNESSARKFKALLELGFKAQGYRVNEGEVTVKVQPGEAK